MFHRFKHVVIAGFRVFDIVVCYLWLAPLYLFGLADQPTGRHLISSYVGKAAYNKRKWGLTAELFIDWLALKLGDGPNHCYRAYIFYKPIDVTTLLHPLPRE